ncbi:MAG TPA: hypothetical protein VFF52_05955 [Isosphaeraceae bacterium]|nr:hypothetical protein [Isosphaeraceae bacterium]
MNDPRETQWPRRRLLVSGLSLFSGALTLGSASLLSGCGDDKSAGPLENVVDPTKTQAGQDSMKAYMGQMQAKTGKTGKKK